MRINPKIFFISFLAIIFTGGLSAQNQIDLNRHFVSFLSEDISLYHIKGKKVSGERQNIWIISVPLVSLGKEYNIELAWSDSLLMETSRFAEKLDAISAINAGFFNVRDGGSVTYLEYGNENVARRNWKGDAQDPGRTNLNGALLNYRNGDIRIETAKSSREYLNSNKESWVLVSGPVLLQGGNKSRLLEGSFVKNRHPRTALGLSGEFLFLVSVDGRNKKARGMTLFELQDLLLSLDCREAINLDGGGSTTMWVQYNDFKGVINCPSDNRRFDSEGERKVANSLLILKN